MIKLNHIYVTKNDYYIIIIRHPKAKWYEVHCSSYWSDLQDFDYIWKSDHLFASYKLSDVRYYARKIIDGEDF